VTPRTAECLPIPLRFFPPMSISRPREFGAPARYEPFDSCCRHRPKSNQWCPAYSPLLEAQLCRITGFETQASALAELNLRKGSQRDLLSLCARRRQNAHFNLCAYSRWMSTFVPGEAALDVFSFFKKNARSWIELRHVAPTI
jgi:hypothetical protein